jgi:mRNA interferase YafQ
MKYRFRQFTKSILYMGSLECHIEPDWLLIYEIDDEQKVVRFMRTGTHSDLF